MDSPNESDAEYPFSAPPDDYGAREDEFGSTTFPGEVYTPDLPITEENDRQVFSMPQQRRFTTWEFCQLYIDHWTTPRGYAMRVNSTGKRGVDGKPNSYYLRCTRSESRNSYKRQSSRNKGSFCTNCPYKMTVARNPDTDLFYIKSHENAHNHEPSYADTDNPAIRRRARITPMGVTRARDLIRTHLNTGVSASVSTQIIRQTLPEVPIIRKDVYNDRYLERRRELSGYSALQNLLRGVQSHQFIHFETIDDKDQLTKLAFFHENSLAFLALYPDILLLDSTYSTNRYRMPLMEIVGSTPTNETFYVGGAFIQKENTETFTWLLQGIKDLLIQRQINLPRVLVCDRDTAQIKAISQVFPAPESHVILCLWHVNKAVLANIKKQAKSMLLPAEQARLQPEFALQRRQDMEAKISTFEEHWRAVIYDTSPQDAERAWRRLQTLYRNDHNIPGFYDYIQSWWPYRHSFWRCYTKDYLCFGNTTTSRLEGMHHVLKKALQGTQSNIPTVVQQLFSLLENRNYEICARMSRERMLTYSRFTGVVWHIVQGKISQFALNKCFDTCLKAYKKVDINIKDLARAPEWLLHENTRPCTGSWTTSWGIPCPHRIAQAILAGIPLSIDDFDIHWRLDRIPPPPGAIIRDPIKLPRHRYDRGNGQRIRSEFERVDQQIELQLRASQPQRSQERGQAQDQAQEQTQEHQGAQPIPFLQRPPRRPGRVIAIE